MNDIVVICGVITATAAATAIVFKCYVWAQRIIEGVRCQLRTAMLHTYYTCKDTKVIRQYEAENFDKNYNVMFSTYAVPLIIGEVKKVIRTCSGINRY